MKRQFDAAIRQYEVKEAAGNGRVEWEDGVKSVFPSVKLLGKTVQPDYTGRNLADIGRIASDGRIAVVSDSIIIAPAAPYAGNGSAGSGLTLRELAPGLAAGKQYTLSFVTESSQTFIYLSGWDQAWHCGTSVTMTEAMLSSYVVFYGMSYDSGDPETDCRVSNFQMEEGDCATPYEPYVGGMPSPCPLYPQKILSNNATVRCSDADGTYDGGTASAPPLLCAVNGEFQSTYDPQTGRFVNWWWDKITLNGSEAWSIYPATKGFFLPNALPETMGINAYWCNMVPAGRKGEYTTGTRTQMVCGLGNKILYYASNPFYDEALADRGLANWKAHLAKQPLELRVARNEPEITSIGPRPLTCPTDYGQILQVAGDVPDCPMEVQYLAHGGAANRTDAASKTAEQTT